jgi:shikimate dehydrogenase
MGHPVAHSRSPLIHGYWLAQLGIAGSYELMDLAPDAFPEFVTHLAERGFVGGNVTVPHKEAAFRLAERRDAAAEAVGAVNTLWLEHGRLTGGNSDVHGFIAHLDDRAPGWDAPGGLAVILGAGGAARGAAYGLQQRGLRVALVNRTADRAQELAAHFGAGMTVHAWEELAALLPHADLLVNCTSLGMVGKPPLALDIAPLARRAVVYDIVYAPLETALLARARERGHRVVDGLGMLLHQAGYGFEKWFGARPTVTAELRARVEADLLGRRPGS